MTLHFLRSCICMFSIFSVEQTNGIVHGIYKCRLVEAQYNSGLRRPRKNFLSKSEPVFHLFRLGRMYCKYDL